MRILFIHSACWLIWLAINGISLFGMIPSLTGTQWLQLTWNYFSLIISFYSIGWMASRYFSRFSAVRFESLNGRARARYLLLKWPVFGIMVVTMVYVTASILLDDYCFGYKYPTLISHIDQRLTRISTYVAGAVAWKYYSYYATKKRKQSEINKARVISMQDRYLELKKINDMLLEIKCRKSN